MPKISDLPSLMIGYDYEEPYIVANGEDTNGNFVTGKFCFSDLFDLGTPVEPEEVDNARSVDLLLYGQPNGNISGFFAMHFYEAISTILPDAIGQLSYASLSEVGAGYVPVADGTYGYQVPVADFNLLGSYPQTLSDGPLVIYYEGALASTSTYLSEYLGSFLPDYFYNLPDPSSIYEYDKFLFLDTHGNLATLTFTACATYMFSDYASYYLSEYLPSYLSDYLSEYMAEYFLEYIPEVSTIGSDSFLVVWRGGNLNRVEVQNFADAGLMATLKGLDHYSEKMSALSDDLPMLMWNPHGDHDDSMFYVTLSELKAYFNS